MKYDQLKVLKDKFYDGTLAKAEESRFKDILKNEGDRSKLLAYFEIHKNVPTFSPISRQAFFDNMNKKAIKKRKKHYLVAASLAAVLIVSSIFFYRSEYSKQRYSSADIDQSVEVTRLALNAMSSRISIGISKVEKGIDLSKPYHSMEKLNNQTQNK